MGVSNEIILENFLRIDGRGIPIEVRIPVIPGINDDRRNIEATVSLLKGISNLTRVTLLPYHVLGESKYRRAGRSCKLEGLEPPTREHIEQVAGWIWAFDLEVLVR